MPFFKRVCLFPWQSLFMEVQEGKANIMIIQADKRRRILFITYVLLIKNKVFLRIWL